MINLKIALKPPAPRTRLPPFPSRSLIIMNITSCLLSTASFTLSSTQIGSRHALIVIPNLIGFLLTIPYHGYLYVCTQRHLETKRKTPHSGNIEAILTPHRIIAAFLLVTSWVLILLVNILFSLKAAAGAIITTVLGGLELFTLFILAIKSSQEMWTAAALEDHYRGAELRV